MARHLTVITGASRGMGLAIAQQLLDQGHDLLCISRKTQPALEERAARAGVACEQWPQDLARAAAVAARLETWLQSKARGDLESVTLINNAALLPTIAPLGHIALQELEDGIRVDLEAPLLLTSAFLRATAAWRATRKVLNISSGLGRRAMASQIAAAWRGGALNVESTNSKCRTPASRTSSAISSTTCSGSRRRYPQPSTFRYVQ